MKFNRFDTRQEADFDLGDENRDRKRQRGEKRGKRRRDSFEGRDRDWGWN